ncbi:MAG: tetratricopeptide repeat protein [Pseudomonadota bacterium]
MKDAIQTHCSNDATETATERLGTALRAFNVYRGDPVALADAAIEADPEFAMPHILKGYLFGLATEPEATCGARSIVAVARDLAKTDIERSHVSALQALVGNNWTEAAQRLDHHNMAFPHDILGLQAGHLMDFYRANARNLRDRLARVLPNWSDDQPGYANLLGMYAFGLEETGDYARAEAVGREATERDPLDCWAHHAVAHVLEMQGRAEDGLDWMASREPHWSGDDNFFKVHNWWHKALYHLDLGQSDKVIQLYDARIRGDESVVALDLVDASALLWRLQMEDHDVGDRWADVARCWDAHADGRLYPFNDWHAVMAYLGSGRTAEVNRMLARYQAADDTRDETARWARATGLPLIQGFRAFREERYDDAVEILHRARFVANAFGGSHAQRDIIDWTLTEAATRSGNHRAAEALANERLAVKPHSPINQRFLHRAQTQASGAIAAE